MRRSCGVAQFAAVILSDATSNPSRGDFTQTEVNQSSVAESTGIGYLVELLSVGPSKIHG